MLMFIIFIPTAPGATRYGPWVNQKDMTHLRLLWWVLMSSSEEDHMKHASTSCTLLLWLQNSNGSAGINFIGADEFPVLRSHDSE